MNNQEAIKELKEVREECFKVYVQYHSGTCGHMITAAEKIDKVVEFLESQKETN